MKSINKMTLCTLFKRTLVTFILPILAFATLPGFSAGPTCSKVFADFNKNMGQAIGNTTWVETTADDGKPLFIDLKEKDGQLFLTFFKTREGLWAEGNAEICPASVEKKWQANISKSDVTVGKRAPWIVRWGFSGGARFKLTLLDAGKLKISTLGWSGEFVPATRLRLQAEQNLATSSQSKKL